MISEMNYHNKGFELIHIDNVNELFNQILERRDDELKYEEYEEEN
jgi:hypothetical protein